MHDVDALSSALTLDEVKEEEGNSLSVPDRMAN